MNTTTASLQEQLQHLIDHKTKPVGALGKLEQLALQCGLIQETTQPVIRQPHIVVFAGDHGIARTGLVNPYPQEVTAQMVMNFLQGGAAINVFCRQQGLQLTVVDAGVNTDFGFTSPAQQDTHFIPAKVGYGTNNYMDSPAMTPAQVDQAILKGKEIIAAIAASGCNCIGFGEMGIGNTSSAALIMSAITGLPLIDCTGRGTGADDALLQTKLATLEKVFHKFQTRQDTPPATLEILQQFGGFEIAMMTGAYLQAASEKMIIVVDGFIATAALLIAQAMNKSVLKYCIFAHASEEQGHIKMLEYLQAKPLLQLGLRLGEGTGAALAMPLIQSAVVFLSEMASFESAGVSKQASN